MSGRGRRKVGRKRIGPGYRVDVLPADHRQEREGECSLSALDNSEPLAEALAEIAVGKPGNGCPFSGHDAREIARRALVKAGRSWPPRPRRDQEKKKNGKS